MTTPLPILYLNGSYLAQVKEFKAEALKALASKRPDDILAALRDGTVYSWLRAHNATLSGSLHPNVLARMTDSDVRRQLLHALGAAPEAVGAPDFGEYVELAPSFRLNGKECRINSPVADPALGAIRLTFGVKKVANEKFVVKVSSTLGNDIGGFVIDSGGDTLIDQFTIDTRTKTTVNYDFDLAALAKGADVNFTVNGSVILTVQNLPHHRITVASPLVEEVRNQIVVTCTGNVALYIGGKACMLVSGENVISIADYPDLAKGFRFIDSTGMRVKKIELGNYDAAEVTSFSHMFYKCRNVEELDLSGWKIGHSNERIDMFWGCHGLQRVYARGCSAQTVNIIRVALSDAGLNNTQVITK